MSEPDPMTQTMKIPDAKNTFSRLVNQVYRKEIRVLVEKSGIPVAAIISVDDLQRLQQLEREWETTTRALERVSEAFADVPVEELEAKIDEIIATGRAREAAERFADVDRMREAFADVPPEEIVREVERSVAAARERRRQRTPEAAARSA